MELLIASDHAGFVLKKQIIEFYSGKIHFTDFGSFSTDSCDYPDIIHPLAKAISSAPDKTAIIICGSGNGVAMTANKYKNVRAALCWNVEVAKLAKQHNNANVLSLPARFISETDAYNIIDAFLNTNFEGGRHLLRVNKINIK